MRSATGACAYRSRMPPRSTRGCSTGRPSTSTTRAAGAAHTPAATRDRSGAYAGVPAGLTREHAAPPGSLAAGGRWPRSRLGADAHDARDVSDHEAEDEQNEQEAQPALAPFAGADPGDRGADGFGDFVEGLAEAVLVAGGGVGPRLFGEHPLLLPRRRARLVDREQQER